MTFLPAIVAWITEVVIISMWQTLLSKEPPYSTNLECPKTNYHVRKLPLCRGEMVRIMSRHAQSNELRNYTGLGVEALDSWALADEIPKLSRENRKALVSF